jgi:hypothetical protein
MKISNVRLEFRVESAAALETLDQHEIQDRADKLLTGRASCVVTSNTAGTVDFTIDLISRAIGIGEIITKAKQAVRETLEVHTGTGSEQ